MQNYLIFQPIFRYFKINSISHVIEYVFSWQSKGSAEVIKLPSTSDNGLKPTLSYCLASRIRVKFTKSCLIQDKIIFNHGKVVNIYIAYELGASTSNIGDPTLKNALFGAVTWTKNVDIEKYKYSGYGIGFDRRSSFSFPGGGFGQNVLISGVGMSSSPQIDNKKKEILVFGIGPTEGLESTLTAEKMYSIKFTL